MYWGHRRIVAKCLHSLYVGGVGRETIDRRGLLSLSSLEVRKTWRLLQCRCMRLICCVHASDLVKFVLFFPCFEFFVNAVHCGGA